MDPLLTLSYKSRFMGALKINCFLARYVTVMGLQQVFTASFAVSQCGEIHPLLRSNENCSVWRLQNDSCSQN